MKRPDCFNNTQIIFTRLFDYNIVNEYYFPKYSFNILNINEVQFSYKTRFLVIQHIHIPNVGVTTSVIKRINNISSTMKFAMLFFIIAISYSLIEVKGQTAQSGEVYCGRRLAENLSYWCRVIYQDKRSGNGISRHPFNGWLDRQIGGTEVQKRGIVDDCCYQPCTLDVLISYC